MAQTHPQLLPEAWWAKPDRAKCEIVLPTEWQWEKAARGKKGNDYPYGKPFDAARANTNETGIGQTSAAGIFPSSAAVFRSALAQQIL